MVKKKDTKDGDDTALRDSDEDGWDLDGPKAAVSRAAGNRFKAVKTDPPPPSL